MTEAFVSSKKVEHAVHSLLESFPAHSCAPPHASTPPEPLEPRHACDTEKNPLTAFRLLLVSSEVRSSKHHKIGSIIRYQASEMQKSRRYYIALCSNKKLKWVCLCCSRSSDDDSDEDDLEDDDLEDDENFEEGISRARPGTSVSGVNGSSPHGGSPRGGSPRGRSLRGSSPRGNSMSNLQVEQLEVPDLDPDKQHSLEEALLKQMDMQKRLHEQLEVRRASQPCPNSMACESPVLHTSGVCPTGPSDDMVPHVRGIAPPCFMDHWSLSFIVNLMNWGRNGLLYVLFKK